MTFRWRSFGGILDRSSRTSRVKNRNLAKKATGNERAHGVEDSLKQIDESVKVDGNLNKLEVMGKVDPSKVQEMVECKTKKEVELILPSPEMEEDRAEKKGTEGKSKKRIMPIIENDKTNEKIEERITTLKINSFCCEDCNKRVKEVLKTKGLEIVAMNREKDLIEVRGAVDMTELKSYMKDKLRKDIVVVDSRAVMSSTKAEDGTIQECKDKGGGGKKEKYGGAMRKSSVVLKTTLHCKGCGDRIRKRALEIKGVEKVSINKDGDNDIIQVNGTMNVEEMTSYLKKELEKSGGHFHQQVQDDKESIAGSKKKLIY